MSGEWKTPFDDDGHTFQDGPLTRFFRMRKWFFAVGVLLLLLHTGWWDFSATTSALALSELPILVFRTALTATGIYLLVQSALVTLQIGLTYSETVEARAKAIKSEAAFELRSAADKQEAALGTHRDEAARIARLLARAMYEHETLETLPPGRVRIVYHAWEGVRRKAEEDATHIESEVLDPEADFHQALMNADRPPASRAGYMAAGSFLELTELRARASELQRKGTAGLLIGSEMALDALRIVPTLAFLVYALIVHGTLAGVF